MESTLKSTKITPILFSLEVMLFISNFEAYYLTFRNCSIVVYAGHLLWARFVHLSLDPSVLAFCIVCKSGKETVIIILSSINAIEA